MSKGIYYTKVRLYKNGKGISSEDYENVIESKVHYGEIPEAYDTKSILAEKLFGCAFSCETRNISIIPHSQAFCQVKNCTKFFNGFS